MNIPSFSSLLIVQCNPVLGKVSFALLSWAISVLYIPYFGQEFIEQKELNLKGYGILRYV